MKIFAYAKAAWPSLGGIETFLTDLGEFLAAEPGVEYRLASENPFDGENPNPYPTYWSPDTAQLDELIGWADVVHTHVMHLGVLRSARRQGKRIINTNHDVTMVCPKGDKMRWDGACTNRAGPVVCSQCLLKTGQPLHRLIRPPAKGLLSYLTDAQVVTSPWAVERYPLFHKRLIPYGIDTSRYAPKQEYALSGEQLRLVFMGRVVPEKGLQVVAEAAAIARDAGRPFTAVICGDGDYMPALRELIDARGVAACFEFLGRVDGDAKVAALRDADAGVVPSLWEEAFGITAIEMMSVGLPVIASRTGGLAAVVEPVGVLIERGDADGLARAVMELSEDEARRRAMGEAGRREAVEKYDLSRMNREYLELYRRVLGAG